MKKNFEILEFVGNSETIKTVKRITDGGLFTIGDLVTNYMKMVGKITKFDYSIKSNEIFVYTTWSGIGTNLDSVIHEMKLPTAFQLNDEVEIDFGDAGKIKNGKIIKCHIGNGSIQYDIEIWFLNSPTCGMSDKPWKTRLYNVSASYVYPKSYVATLFPITGQTQVVTTSGTVIVNS